MNRTFTEVICKLNSSRDKKGVRFLDYIVSKYFCQKSTFMTIKEIMPYLEEGDCSDLINIVSTIE